MHDIFWLWFWAKIPYLLQSSDPFHVVKEELSRMVKVCHKKCHNARVFRCNKCQVMAIRVCPSLSKPYFSIPHIVESYRLSLKVNPQRMSIQLPESIPNASADHYSSRAATKEDRVSADATAIVPTTKTKAMRRWCPPRCPCPPWCPPWCPPGGWGWWCGWWLGPGRVNQSKHIAAALTRVGWC